MVRQVVDTTDLTGVSFSIAPVSLATSYTWSTSCGSIVGPNTLSAISVDWPSSFTNCVLSVAAVKACGTGGVRTLSVSSVPSMPPALGGNAAPCAGTVESYSTAGSTGATSYAWTVPAGSLILGPSNGASIQVLWGSTSGNITVRAGNVCGNSGIRTMPCTISCRMSQVNKSSSFGMSVYPNPAVSIATIEMMSDKKDNIEIEILDLEGRMIMQKNISLVEGINKVDLDISNLQKGIYSVRARSAMDWSLVKLIVQ